MECFDSNSKLRCDTEQIAHSKVLKSKLNCSFSILQAISEKILLLLKHNISILQAVLEMF